MHWRAHFRTIVDDVPPDEVVDAIAECERAKALLWQRLNAPDANGKPSDLDFLTPDELARSLSTDIRWIYRHKADLGAVSLSGKCLRFPRKAVERYLARKRL